ncbi:hypothetical protein L596_021397 [Steinernema carpocapsae]|uniref:Ig-like domain-containing protein n=1 Tax=Steinernema carpocapsae TaxID=34508 RepID=A0A4U5MJG3_STECR|nr:hypothetical protein L596_021397 [Steinernema carpocapsae]
MFVYMRPVFEHYGDVKLEPKGNDTVETFAYAFPNGVAVLPCKVVGFPKPKVTWYKGAEQLVTKPYVAKVVEKKYTIVNGTDLRINNVEEADLATYRCVAKNSFPWNGSADERSLYSATLETHLQFSSRYGIIILLILIIYCCAYCKRRMSHSDNYDVASREKNLQSLEAQRLHEDSDGDY